MHARRTHRPGSLHAKPCTRGRGARDPAGRHTVSSVSPRALVVDDETPVSRTRRARQDVPLPPRALPVRALRARLHDAAGAARRDDPVGADDGRRGQQGDADRLREVPDGRRLRERRPHRARGRSSSPPASSAPRPTRSSSSARRSSSVSTARCRRAEGPRDAARRRPQDGERRARQRLRHPRHHRRHALRSPRRRFGWTEEEDPVKVEHEVGALFMRKDWTMLSHVVIFHGRRTCHAKKPACGACPVARGARNTGPARPTPTRRRRPGDELAPK